MDEDFESVLENVLDQLGLGAGPIELIEARDGQEPITHEHSAAAFDVCAEGHLHQIVFGDPAAVQQYIAERSGEVLASRTELREGELAVASAVAPFITGDTPQDIFDAIFSPDDIENMPEIILNHSREMVRITEQVEAGELTIDDLARHMIRAMVDPAFCTAMKGASDGGDLAPYDTLLEAALDGVSVPGDFLAHGPRARRDLIDEVLSEADGN